MKRILIILLFSLPSLFAQEFPLCGVLTTSGYSKVTFLIPQHQNAHIVERYEVVNYEKSVPPLEAIANWWICITDGKVLSTPTEDTYGKIEIYSYKTDQTNGERGQE